MTHTIDREGTRLVLRVTGRLDVQTTPELEDALKGQLDGITDLVVDLTSVDYVSSMGLRLLLALQKRMFKQGSMRVTNVGESVMELFGATGFDEILTIE